MLSASVQNKEIHLGNPPENLLFLICMKWQFHWNRLIEMEALHIDLCFYCKQLGDTTEWAELNSQQSNDWSTSTLVGHAMNLVSKTTTIISKLLQTRH